MGSTFYSYITLMDPASNVSVPLPVVMRTRSRVPESVLEPAHIIVPAPPDAFEMTPCATHKFDPIAVKMTEPVDVTEPV